MASNGRECIYFCVILVEDNIGGVMEQVHIMNGEDLCLWTGGT